MKKLLFTLTCLFFCLIATASAQALRTPSIFSDGMVLQRGKAVPVWGWATPDALVTVKFQKQKKETIADKSGRWRVTLDALDIATERQTLLISSEHEIEIPIPNRKRMGKKKIEEFLLFSNVLVGDVWIVCGQSNAMMTVEASAGFDKAVKEADKYPLIRLAQVGKRNPHLLTKAVDDPESYWGSVKWEDSSWQARRSSVKDIPGGFSALGYYFARELSKHFEKEKQTVPLGVIEVTAIMRCESWVSQEEIDADPVLKSISGRGYPFATGRCYLANIAPLAPYAVRGAIYYQGEMNASSKGKYFRPALPALVRSWRKAWNDEIPFLVVQLPGFIAHKGGTDERMDMSAKDLANFKGNTDAHGFCFIREAQLEAVREIPNAALAVTIDLGDAFDIHPAKKLEVAERLVLLARRLVYGEKDLQAQAPLPGKIAFSGNKATVRFAYAEGLHAKDGKVTAFELAGEDGAWQTATASIKGDTVTVTSDKVTKAAAVRYAWRGYPEWSLLNGAKIPASPFRYPIPEEAGEK